MKDPIILSRTLGHIEAEIQSVGMRLADLKEALLRIDTRLTVVERQNLQWGGALSFGVAISTLMGTFISYALKVWAQ